jgi:CHRD domain-containing protein
MTKIRICYVTLGAVLLAATPAHAAVHAILENPPNVQTVGDITTAQAVEGITGISGWAFSTLPSTAVTIKLRVDGITTDTVVPCCGPRQDVVNALGPDTPLNTGFSLLFNYGILSAGPHTIGVELSAPGEAIQFIDHSVRVVKPANAEVLSDFTLPESAACSIADNQIVITGAQVTPTGGAPTTIDLGAQFSTSSQSLVITEASGVPPLTTFIAHLNGSQSTPPVDTAATGTGHLTLNPDDTITCSLTTTGLTGGTDGHIHLAEAGVAGQLKVLLVGGPTDWSCPTAPAHVLTPSQKAALLDGRLYMNVHSTVHPEGDIRGQLVAP